MAELIINGYKRLFEVRILHHYWLDEGATVFDLIPRPEQRDKRLLSYDMRPFLALAPTAATAKAFKAYRCVYENTALGCVVAAPQSTVLPVDTMFELVVMVRNAAFYNYTALTLQPQKIYELYHQPEDRIYRYKENVAVLSNLSGASRVAGLDKALFLSSEFPPLAVDDQVESLVLSGAALVQLTGDQPGAGTQQLNAIAADSPVFVHQGDAPAIAPPTGLEGAPSHGLILSGDITDDVFAFIRLSAIRADDDDFSFIDGSGEAKTPHPVFQVRFKNRSTKWQYLNKSTGALNSAEADPLPLTYFGNASPEPKKQKPSEGLVKAVKSGAQISQFVSEIFV